MPTLSFSFIFNTQKSRAKSRIFVAVFLLAASLLFRAVPVHAAVFLPRLVTVTAEGAGMTYDEALKDARRKAAEKVVGILATGETRVADNQVREKMAQLSLAFMDNDKYKILEERQEGKIWRLRIEMEIDGKSPLTALVSESPDRSPFDGAKLFEQALAREEQTRRAAEILIEVFRSIPYGSYVRGSVQADGTFFSSFSSGRPSSEKRSVGVRLVFDRERYFTELAPLLAWILDYAAEAKLKDVPLFLDTEGGSPKPVEVALLSAPDLDSLAKYKRFMGVKNENRYIDLPGLSGFVNVYLMTKNYYFDGYRLAPETFALLMEALLLPERGGRLGGRIFESASLKTAFKTQSGQVLSEQAMPWDTLGSVMVFTDLAGLRRSPYAKGKEGQLDERRHALYILPCFGELASQNPSDYRLIEEDSGSVSVTLSPEDLQRIDHAECFIEVKAE
jgi:hypothetical protein